MDSLGELGNVSECGLLAEDTGLTQAVYLG